MLLVIRYKVKVKAMFKMWNHDMPLHAIYSRFHDLSLTLLLNTLLNTKKNSGKSALAAVLCLV